MKYKVGDKVRVKSLEWYNKNKKDSVGVIVPEAAYVFNEEMSKLCGKEVETTYAQNDTSSPYYEIKDSIFRWTDEMFENSDETIIKKIINTSIWEFIILLTFCLGMAIFFSIFREGNEPFLAIFSFLTGIFFKLLLDVKKIKRQ